MRQGYDEEVPYGPTCSNYGCGLRFAHSGPCAPTAATTQHSARDRAYGLSISEPASRAGNPDAVQDAQSLAEAMAEVRRAWLQVTAPYLEPVVRALAVGIARVDVWLRGRS